LNQRCFCVEFGFNSDCGVIPALSSGRGSPGFGRYHRGGRAPACPAVWTMPISRLLKKLLAVLAAACVLGLAAGAPAQDSPTPPDDAR
jgi:hypothetical protein